MILNYTIAFVLAVLLVIMSYGILIFFVKGVRAIWYDKVYESFVCWAFVWLFSIEFSVLVTLVITYVQKGSG